MNEITDPIAELIAVLFRVSVWSIFFAKVVLDGCDKAADQTPVI